MDREQKHLTAEDFKGILSEEDLKHISSCRFCRDNLADYVEENELLRAPADLKASILEQSRRLDVQLIAGTNRASKKLELFFFSLKVGAAVLCSLTLLAVAPNFSKEMAVRTSKAGWQIEQQADRSRSFYEKVDHFAEQLNRLSFTNKEVINHDKKER